MADEKALAILKQGAQAWNERRKAYLGEARLSEPDFAEADLSGADLSRANLAGANLLQANLREADLSSADLSLTNLTRADLTRANLTRVNLSNAILDGAALSEVNLRGRIAGLHSASLRGAVLRKARLYSADLRGADLNGASLSGADLSGADLSEADLRGVNLIAANLRGAALRETNLKDAALRETNLRGANFIATNLSEADLSGADLTGAKFGNTVLLKVDLTKVQGLESVKHFSPSSIGIDTIYKSKGQIPEIFLRGAGVPEPFIVQIKALVGAMEPIQFYSCFISYSSKDRDFAERLHADLQARGVRCWFAAEDLKIGDRFEERIEESIRVYDKIMIVLSDASVESRWVEREVNAAREREDRDNKPVLFPIRIDEAVMEAPQPWAADIRRTRHIGDFCDWHQHPSYRKAFDRLLRDLKASV